MIPTPEHLQTAALGVLAGIWFGAFDPSGAVYFAAGPAVIYVAASVWRWRSTLNGDSQ